MLSRLVSPLVLGLLAAGAVVPQAAVAQTVPMSKSIPAIDAKKLAMALVAKQLTTASGMAVVTDSALATQPVDFKTLGGGIDTVLTQLSAVLPPGATVRAVLVPDTGAAPDGDVVAGLVRAQDAFAATPAAPAASPNAAGQPPVAAPPVAAKTPVFTPGEFEFLGHPVTLAQAAQQISDLHLKPVYILMRQHASLDPVAKLSSMQSEAMKQWASMTDDQRKQAMSVQFSAMMNMEPGDRQQMLGQMMQQGAYMMQMMQQMPPDQQKEFFNEITTEAGKSGLIPPGAGKRPGQ